MTQVSPDMVEVALAKQTDRAMQELTWLSTKAKECGDDALMYAANRAWTELFNIAQSRRSPAPTPQQQQ